MTERRAVLIAAVVLFAGCASAASPFVWKPIDRTLAVEGRGVLMTMPESWILQKREASRYEFRLPRGAFSITADSQPMSHSRAARGVVDLLSETEGMLAARTPPSSFSIEYDELAAEYTLPDGRRLIAFHRTVACPPLHCHLTLIQERGASELPLPPRGEQPRGRAEGGRTSVRGGDVTIVNALLGLGARVAEVFLRSR